MTQRLASAEMEESKIGGGALLCLNTLALRSFEIVHETSIVREALAWRFGVPSAHVLAHHSSTESKKAKTSEPFIDDVDELCNLDFDRL